MLEEKFNVLLHLSGVALCFPDGSGTVAVLDDVNLEISPGELIAVTGVSGSGKSSLLGLLSGELKPTAGCVSWSHELIAVSRIHQDNQLVPFLNVLENVALAVEARKLAGARRAKVMAQEALQVVGLGNLAARAVSSLSGGERQRVAIARAIVSRPTLLLADEPTGALDATNSALVGDLLARVATDTGTAVVVATHDLIVWSRAHRVLEIRDKGLVSLVPETSSTARIVVPRGTA